MVSRLRGEHGDWYYINPGVGGDPYRQQVGGAKIAGMVGGKEHLLLDESKRNYRLKWLNPTTPENYGFWGENFGLHKYNFSEYSPGDRQHFTGALRHKITDETREDDGRTHERGHKWYDKETELEILDWDAYNKDTNYSTALQQRHGRNKFLTLQDIWDAEDVMQGRWSKPAPPPPKAAPPPPPPKPTGPSKLDIEAQLKALGIEHEKAIGGWRDQLAAQKAESAFQLEQLRGTFSQQQQAYQTQAQRERADLESQLNLSFAQRFDKQQQDLTSKYQGLLGEAKTDAEAARVKQAQAFEQRQLDQQAAWDTQSKAWETKDRVYQSQLGELKSSLGVQQDMYSGLQGQYSGLQGKFGDLQGELGEQKGLYSGLQDQFGQAREDWSKQAQGYQQEIGNVKTTLAESQRQAETLGAAVKRNEELAMQNAERARVSASYGSQGKPINQPVKGVRTLNELTPTKKRYTGTRGTFGRSGLRISNLNI